MTHTLTTIIIHVRDMQQSVHFYQDLLRLSAESVGENWSEFDVGTVKIALHPQVEGHSGHANCIPQLCIQVDDLEATCHTLKAGGVAVIGPTLLEGVGVLATCSDPDGISLSLSEAGGGG